VFILINECSNIAEEVMLLHFCELTQNINAHLEM